MYNVKLNNFYENSKNSTVYTPSIVSESIYKIISKKINRGSIILDPCVGQGSLLIPWNNNGYQTIGIDIIDQGWKDTIEYNFLNINEQYILENNIKPDLVILNPPFNNEPSTKDWLKEIKGRPLVPELFLDHIFQLFGNKIPVIIFVPYGFRLNVSKYSKRQTKFIKNYPDISSIVALPKDVYANVDFHSEILIFNIKGLKSHYFIDFGAKIKKR